MHKSRLGIPFLAASLGCVMMVVVRMLLTGSPHSGFLVWNLFLAWIPFLMSRWIVSIETGKTDGRDTAKRRTLLLVLGIAWILFYPNAPYILTDFIHLVGGPARTTGRAFLTGTGLLWYDIILTAAFAFIGHLIGLVSLLDIHGVARRRFTPAISWIIILAAIGAGGYGIYIGRFERLNSWEVFTDPIDSLKTLIGGIFYLKAVLFSVCFAFFIFLTYLPVYAWTAEKRA